MFSGNYFKYDGILSKEYDLKIVNIKTDSTDLALDGEREYITTNLQTGVKFYDLGRKITKPFQFPIEIYTQNGLSMNQQKEVHKWLFDRMQYHKLEIMSTDYNNVYYNCRLINPTLNNYQGMMGYRCTVMCDSPWAWEDYKNKIIDEHIIGTQTGTSLLFSTSYIGKMLLSITGNSTQTVMHRGDNLFVPVSGDISGGSADSVFYQSDISANISFIGSENSELLIRGNI